MFALHAGLPVQPMTAADLLARQALSQLSYTPNPLRLVGLGGLEPPTSRLSGVRSNQLSYRPASLISQNQTGKAGLIPRGKEAGGPKAGEDLREESTEQRDASFVACPGSRFRLCPRPRALPAFRAISEAGFVIKKVIAAQLQGR